MKVLLLSNWDDTCGISIYGNNLYRFMDRNLVTYTQLDVGAPLDTILRLSEEVDLVHINYQPGVNRQFNPAELAIHCQKPMVYTNHFTTYYEPWYSLMSAIVVHGEAPSWEVPTRSIPLGIVDLGLHQQQHTELVLTQGGFPFLHKRYDILCRAAAELQYRGIAVAVLLFMPETYRSPVGQLIQQCQSILGTVPHEIVTDWLDEDEIIVRMNSEASVGVYAGGSGAGISGSVRLSIAAQLPTVVNLHGELFSDILSESGIYPFSPDELVEDAILRAAIGEAPIGLLKKQSFQQTTRLYSDLYQEVLSGRIN